MRKLIVLLCLLSTAFIANAQEQGIAFEKDLTWSKVVKKAKKEKKLIFIDCYTSWCGPCKTLAKDVFTQKEVGDYFNENFINAKYDCDKGEGVELKKKFKVPAYPTLVFYNPMTDQVEHQCVGAGKADWLVENGKVANDRENNLAGLTKRYEAGSLGATELSAYLKVLGTAYMKDKQNEVAISYLQALNVDQLCEAANWELLSKNVNDILSAPIKMVIDNKPVFYNKIGKDVVDAKLEKCLGNSIAPLINWDPRRGTFNEEAYNNMISYLPTLTINGIPGALNKLYMVNAFAKNDYERMFIELENALRYNFDGARYSKLVVMGNIGRLARVEDEAAITKGIKFIDGIIATTTSSFDKANMFETKARLQTAINDTVGAEQSKQEAKKYDELGKQESGGKMMRATMMN
ncbi:MAG: thioredoxin family protein [Marinifilaceae bacterium]